MLFAPGPARTSSACILTQLQRSPYIFVLASTAEESSDEYAKRRAVERFLEVDVVLWREGVGREVSAQSEI